MFAVLTPRLSRLFISLAFVAAVVFDVLFWKESIGVNFLIFILVNLLFLTIGLAVAKRLLQPLAFIALVLSVAFAGSVALYRNEFVSIIAPLLAVMLAAGFAGWVSIEAKDTPIYVYQFAFFRQFFGLFTGWKKLAAAVMAGRDKIARHILYGLLIAAPLVLIFAGLFSSADPIFADWLRRLNIFESAWRVVRIAIMTLIASGGLYILTNEKNAAVAKTQTVWKMAVPTVAVILAVLNLLFAAFVTIQIKYFFGGATYVLASGVTFADYARNGFFELARVLVLAGIIILVIHRSFAATTRNWFITILQVLFISQVGVVAVSALKRMALYQDMYGFTTLRLYVAWFIYLVLGILIISGLALLMRWPFRRYAIGVIGLGLLAGAVVAHINVDNVIAAKNISRWADEKKDFDLDYVTTLSSDAVPAVARLTNTDVLTRLSIDQNLELQSYWERMLKDATSTTWLSHTYSQKRAEQIINATPEAARAIFTKAKQLDESYEKFEKDWSGQRSCFEFDRTSLNTILTIPESASGSAMTGYSWHCRVVRLSDIRAVTVLEIKTLNTHEFKYVLFETSPELTYGGEIIVTKVLFQQNLFSEPGLNSIEYARLWEGTYPLRSYKVRSDGSVIEGNYLLRQHFIHLITGKETPSGIVYNLSEPTLIN